MAKSTVFKIASGIAVVAVIVVVALAVAGVFTPNVDNSTPVVAMAEELEQIQFLGDITTDHVFTIKGSGAIGDINSYVEIIGDCTKVELEKSEIDTDNYIYGVTAKNGFIKGLAYKIILKNGASFAEEDYANLPSLIFRVVADESEVMTLNESRVELAWEEVVIDEDSGAEIIMTVIGGAGAAYSGGTVFLIGEVINGAAYIALRASEADGNDELVYVKEAEINDVYDEIDIYTDCEITEENLTFDEDATIQSIMESDYFLDAYALLFGKKFVDTKNVKFAFDVKFIKSNNVVIKIDVILELVFRNFIPGDVDWEIILKITNSILPYETKLNFKKDPKAFDFTVDMDIITKANLSFKFGKKTEYFTEVNKLLNSLAALGNEGTEVDQGLTFFTWMIPLGALPICIEYTMGAAIRFEFAGQIGFEVINTFGLTFGIVYVNDEITSFSNYTNKFELGNLALTGMFGTKVGLTNEIAISAYGVISIGVIAEAGLYLDVAGRLAVNMGELLDEKQFNFVPAYDFETGIYLDIDIAAKLFKINIKKFKALEKKWPLYNLGYKYIPTEFTEEDETIYISGDYAYLSSFDARAFNIHTLKDEEKPIAIKYDQFKYDLTDAPNITLSGNKIMVEPSVTGKFEDTIVVTSKINKLVTKKLIIKKMAEAPSALTESIDYDKSQGGAAVFDVLLNASKFIGLIGDVAINSDEYSMKGNQLTINSSYMNKLGYGKYTFVFESSKGNINLYVNVMSNEPITAVNSSVDFDMLSPTNAMFKIDLKGNSILSIDGVSSSCYTYQTATNSLCIYGSYLLTLSAGENSFVVNYSNGTSGTLIVNVSDSRMPKLLTSVYEYLTNSNRNIEIPISLYSASFVKVSRNGTELGVQDGEFSGSPLIINNSYLRKLGEGEYTFAIETSQNTLTFTVYSSENIVAVIPVKSAVFDKAEPVDVEFAVITDSNTLTLTGNEVQYAFKTDRFVINGEYLNDLELGVYNFTVGGANLTTTLSVEVINTKTPSIAEADYEFDKAAPQDVVVDISLEAAILESIDGLEDAEFNYADGKLTIYAAALSKVAYGVQEFRINTSVNSFDIAVRIFDTRTAEITSDGSMLFNKVLGNILSVKVELFDKEFVKIEKADGEELKMVYYRYAENTITFANEFAYSLADGNYQFVIKTTGKDLNVYISVEGTQNLKLTTIGDGSLKNPYQIFTKAQMTEFANADVDYSGQHFILNSDIDWDFATISPIGSEDKPFKGVFNGNGYTIKDITIKAKANQYFGLFAYNEGTIKGLNVRGAKIELAEHGSIGAGIIAGCNRGTIENVKVVGEIKAESKSWQDLKNAYFDIGGLVGYNNGTIKNAEVTIKIDASVKGLSILGIKVGGRKSNINVGAVVGYLGADSDVEGVTSYGSITAMATSNNISYSGWFGVSDGASGSGRYYGDFTIKDFRD